MGRTIQISEKSSSLLAQQAAAHGLSLETWIEELASEKVLWGATTGDSKLAQRQRGFWNFRGKSNAILKGGPFATTSTTAVRDGQPVIDASFIGLKRGRITRKAYRNFFFARTK
jgi:hypothetical protein